MKEVKGDMWSYLGRQNFRICVTTNGFIKNDGTGVMGAGNARQAAERFPELPRLLGESLKSRGNRVVWLTEKIISFPVKNQWFEKADLKLITMSILRLNELARDCTDLKFILPRPGCGNGELKYTKVKPLLEKLPDNVFVITNE